MSSEVGQEGLSTSLRAEEVAADGVFIAIGHSPSTELVAGKIKMKPNGYVWTAPYSTATSVPACSPQATSPTTSTARR
jgi:thioredoxin reductase